MDNSKLSIKYGSKTIEFVVQRKNVKNINLKVQPNMEVVVSANEQVPMDYIFSFVKSKASWILKNQEYFKNSHSDYNPNKKYVSGETIRYLGKQYRLKVEQDEKIEDVKYYQGFIHLHIKNKKDYERKEKLMHKWLRNKAEEIFSDSLNRMYYKVEKYEVQKPDVKVRLMKSRWGSALSDKNTILLNYDLIKAPKLCIDYVVLHELIHFIHKNHNKDFYDLLTVLMPDWENIKEMLDEVVIREI